MFQRQPTPFILDHRQQSSPGCCSCSGTLPHFNSGAAFFLGALQLVFGIISICLNIASITIFIKVAQISYGIWIGTVWIVTGCICFAAGQTQRKCLIKACLILSTLSACLEAYYFTAVVFQYLAISGYMGRDEQLLHFGMTTAALVVGLLQLLTAMLTAVLCCQTLGCCCCRAPGPQNDFMIYSTDMYSTGNVAIRPNGKVDEANKENHSNLVFEHEQYGNEA